MKIQAWENHQKAQSEAEMRKIEVHKRVMMFYNLFIVTELIFSLFMALLEKIFPELNGFNLSFLTSN